MIELKKIKSDPKKENIFSEQNRSLEVEWKAPFQEVVGLGLKGFLVGIGARGTATWGHHANFYTLDLLGPVQVIFGRLQRHIAADLALQPRLLTSRHRQQL